MNNFTKWVACWGNATSITDQVEAMYAKNVTLRYPVRMCFDGNKLRFRFSNLTGTEPISFFANIAKAKSDREIDESSLAAICVNGNESIVIEPGEECESDAVDFDVKAGEYISVSIYMDSYTQMNAGTLVTGALSNGFYSYGKFYDKQVLPTELTRPTNWFYFLNTIDVFTYEDNKALICYGDSITAQNWPDDLAIRAFDEGYKNISIIRRAVCGTRILRQYDCITYASYGLKGEIRFPIEANVAGACAIIIQHGINDIIHPVGVEVNEFRPWSDLPDIQELKDGVKKLYIEPARQMGLKVYGGTLLPIYGWRTYEEFREKLKNEYNDWIRTSDDFDGVVDFDKAVRDEYFPQKFKEGYDSGDHLHPSAIAYREMAKVVPLDVIV